ncbi:hypothetical protein OD350_18055 [Clostridium beijerinckii]|uniref:Uncharacterized protein n=1 Tax=Clostridium beijerinckii TaxID=1520 RepID=A0AAX0B802_CLOBE|nr:hypothetical protein [Clostridium beijerinckii]NRT91517.1 hypothetical protein [Clostridium beijerinckii]NYC71042.1 hypothetical protein [Clostridium beijerinckii]UYZ34148.1 hypothetical protein OD350_18055 [Clostridium beijerinckii]
MDFNIGNLSSCVMGAVVQLATTALSLVEETASAVLGAIAGLTNVTEDGEVDEDEVEELLEDIVKLLVGAFIWPFGSGSSDSDNHINGERMVISGNHVEPYMTRNFIEPAIKQIKDWKSENNEDVTWCVVDSGYTDTDKILMKEIAKDNGVNIMFINDRSDLVNYINTGKDKEGKMVEDRSFNKITDVSIFSHGLRNDGGILALNYEDGGNLNISSSELEDIDKGAFLDPHTYFGSCNSATVVDGTSFANEWVKKVGGEAEAISDPTPESEELGGQSSYYDINNQTLKYKIADRVRLISGINFRSEGADNYPKKYVDSDPKKADFYEDIHWVRIHEDGNIENIDTGGPRNEKNN